MRSGGRAGDGAIGGVRRGLEAGVTGETRHHFGFVPQLDIHRIDHGDGGLPTSVVGASDHGVVGQVLRAQAQTLDDGRRQGLGRVAQGQFQFRQAQHGRHLAMSASLFQKRPCIGEPRVATMNGGHAGRDHGAVAIHHFMADHRSAHGLEGKTGEERP